METPAHTSEPIDAVYTWVDGSDPEFQAQLRRYRGAIDSAEMDAGPARFYDNHELRFSLRSLERYAPWIRNVYIVTNGQVPAWIDRSHKRLTLISHEDLFPDPSVLPVFNSRAIEWQLFRIPGLSRQFLYFNDDFFLGQPVAPADFLTPGGGHWVFLDHVDIPIPSQADAQNATEGSLAWTQDLLNARFGARPPRPKIAHAPRFLSRTILEELNRIWAEEILRTAGHRFRHRKDVSLETLFSYYLLECPEQPRIHEVIRPESYRLAQLSSPAVRAWGQLAGIARWRPMFFCLNDDNISGSRAASTLIRRSTRALMKLYYWPPSSFETDSARS